jgi:hypothetical protein
VALRFPPQSKIGDPGFGRRVVPWFIPVRFGKFPFLQTFSSYSTTLETPRRFDLIF